MSGWNRRALIFFIVLCALVPFSLVIATLAGYAHQNPYFEIVSDYRPYILLLAIIFAVPVIILWRAQVWRRLSSFCLGCLALVIAINAWGVLPWLLARPAPKMASASGTKVKCLAFNVESSNQRFADVRAFVQSEAPDIAMFCEADAKTPWP